MPCIEAGAMHSVLLKGGTCILISGAIVLADESTQCVHNKGAALTSWGILILMGVPQLTKYDTTIHKEAQCHHQLC